MGHQITYVMNITDIDDKIINRVNERGVDYYEFVASMEADFMADMAKLGIKPPTVVTRVTQYVDKIVKYIERIEDNGFAYVSNSSVYFDSVAYRSKGFNFSPLKIIVEDEFTDN